MHAEFILKHTASPVFLVDSVGRISDVNKVACSSFGYSRNEFLELTIFDITPKFQQKQWSSHWENLMRQHLSVMDALILKKGGTPVSVEIDVCYSVEEGNEYACIFVSDIYDQQRDEELQMAYRFFESVGAGILIADGDGTTKLVNPAFTKITGFTADEVIGEEANGIAETKLLNTEPYAFLKPLLISSDSCEGEVWCKHKDGEDYLHRTCLSVSKDKHGNTRQISALFSDITELRRAEEAVAHKACHDTLTGLVNRSLFKARVNKAIARARRDEHPLAIIFIDLDDFKGINDTHGHGVGDKLLQQAAFRLRESVRDGDTVSRISGDEFTVLLESIGSDSDGAKTALKIIDLMREPFIIEDNILRITISVGVSVFPLDGGDYDELLKHADTAMYHAKAHGKNEYQMFNQEMDRRITARLQLEQQVRFAIDQNELVVHYQPQVSVVNGRITGWEALVRWIRDDGTVVAPCDFVPLANKSGLIYEIDKQVLDMACLQTRQWHDRKISDGRLAINMSVRRLDGKGFPELFEATLMKHGLPPEKVCIEIAESAVMADMKVAIANLNAIRELGAKVALDAFGAGWASLANLRMLPMDELKIDRSFIKNPLTDKDGIDIATSIAQIGKVLGLQIVAEGVETKEQLALVRTMGCDIAQGYYLSRPVDADLMESLLHNNDSQRKYINNENEVLNLDT